LLSHNLKAQTATSSLLLVSSSASLLLTVDAVAVMLVFQHISSCCICNYLQINATTTATATTTSPL